MTAEERAKLQTAAEALCADMIAAGGRFVWWDDIPVVISAKGLAYYADPADVGSDPDNLPEIIDDRADIPVEVEAR